MDLQKAKQVISANCNVEKNSLYYLLYEECDFAVRAYYEENPKWLNDDLYDLQK